MRAQYLNDGVVAQKPLRRLVASVDASTNPDCTTADSTFRFDVAVVGLGYVGLPTALAFHDSGHRVAGVDISEDRRSAIRAERVDLVDSDRARLRKALIDQEFYITSDHAVLSRARSIIIAVPTPVDDHRLPNLAILRTACSTVVERAVPGQVIVLSSTTYIGSTTDLLVTPLRNRGFKIGVDVHVAFSPERIDPGNAHHDHNQVPRVIGGATPGCAQHAMNILGLSGTVLHQVSSAAVAEMTKLFENTFRAVNIALVNELAEICSALDLDVIEVLEAASTKPYGFMPFLPGPGVGGHCIPCDPHYLLWQLRPIRQPAPVIENAMASIARRPIQVVDRIRRILSEDGKGLPGARVLILGVTYKPNVQDLRESPALVILEELQRSGAEVAFHDPLVEVLRLRTGERLNNVGHPERYAADIVVVHTLHSRMELGWLDRASLVLDTTYRLPHDGRRFTL